MLVSKSLVQFLTAQSTKQPSTLLDRVLARLYALEVQVNVAKGDGEPVAGKRHTYTNGVYEYFGFRIPHHADSVPDWTDWDIKWPLDLHADAIGATGWDWREGRSWWVGYDVDSKQGHAAGLDEAQLQVVIDAGLKLPYLEIRKSSSGRGLHLYVLFDGIPTANHTEHSVLARAVLSKMCQDSGFDFRPYIDVFGGNMWVWRRNQVEASFQLIKDADGLLSDWTEEERKTSATVDAFDKIPLNWRDTIPPTKHVPEKHTAGCALVLSEAQKQFVDTLAAGNCSTIWQPEKTCLHAHTLAVKAVHTELKLRGVFETISVGEHPDECNCFCYPLENDAWRIVRFSQGTQEAPTWTQDGTSWTWCDINKSVDLSNAAVACGGVELPKSKGYIFENAEEAVAALSAMDIELQVPEGFEDRRIKLENQQDGRTVISLERRQEDRTPTGWSSEKRGWFERLGGQKQAETNDISERYRLVLDDERAKAKSDWWIRHHTGWGYQTDARIQKALQYELHSAASATEYMGKQVTQPWKFVDLPFDEEYPGFRLWNFHSAQYRVQPTTKTPCHPTWDMTFNHTFAGLDDAVREDAWCRDNHICTGRDYALLWVACMLRKPFERVPYLFLTGGENCGKSTFHESLRHLITSNGIANATNFVGGRDMFTGALKHAVLVYIEEKSFANNKTATEIIKDWTGDEYVHIRGMRAEGYDIRNKFHFVHAANDINAAPFKAGPDTRLTVCWVDDLKQRIYRSDLHLRLQAEAPHIMRTLLEMTIPPPVDSRFCLPMLDTDVKRGLAIVQQTFMERFIAENCLHGNGIPFAEFQKRYTAWAAAQVEYDGNSSLQHISAALSSKYPLSSTGEIKLVSHLTWKKPCTDR